MSEQLEDEILSINAIYEPSTLQRIAEDSSICILAIPPRPDIAVRVEFPPDYPEAPPSILGTESTGPDVAKGQGQQLVDVLRTVLSEIYLPGAPCIFELIEETTAKLQQLGLSAAESKDSRGETIDGGQGDYDDVGTASNVETQSSTDIGSEPPWVISDLVTEKKSVFIARAAQIDSVEQAKQFLHHLLITDKRVARATHNITAWRVQGANAVQYQDCDDDGETAAGGRLLHLLELMTAWNVMVVVTRWYGGVHLGPDRFRIINQVARDAVVKGGWSEQGSKRKPKK
ncbi:hypothetical protein AMS68_007755 [Peltaster fructicola]|uniref:RWD domain-containing protein n=1 Tax=Peltaster fructicola TaxID=286661 RepID=A0A6H0Y5W9_9PEZI|nr:hypothetical protein AMS68_007755 [Peltaster fructicola]